MQKTCQNCGLEYKASRSSQKFCSNTCRQKAHHDKCAYPFTGEVCPPKINVRPLSQEEVDATIRNAHETATDLSRASAGTPSPLCLQLARVAVTLNDALEAEGL